MTDPVLQKIELVMMSAEMRRAHDVAADYNVKLKATDPRLNFCVRIIHEEGTIYFFERAFLMQWKDPSVTPDPQNAGERQGEWLLVFTEHHGFHVFAFDDLMCYDQFSRVHLSPEILK